MTRWLVAIVLVLVFASGVAADKTLTYFTITLRDVSQVCFRQDTTGNRWTALVTALVRSSSGTGYQTTLSGPVTAGQRAAIENFITNHSLAPLNTQEGL